MNNIPSNIFIHLNVIFELTEKTCFQKHFKFCILLVIYFRIEYPINRVSHIFPSNIFLNGWELFISNVN